LGTHFEVTVSHGKIQNPKSDREVMCEQRECGICLEGRTLFFKMTCVTVEGQVTCPYRRKMEPISRENVKKIDSMTLHYNLPRRPLREASCLLLSSSLPLSDSNSFV